MQYNTLTGSGSLDHYEPSYGIFSDIWDRSYGDQSWELAPLFYISHTIDVCIERQNPIKEGIARIWKSYLFQRMTDLYGDIPYSEAFVKPLPKFDTQESIYIDLIEQINIGKAGKNRLRGRRPKVRGVVMNPVDHPHGGGEGRTSGGRHPVTPWGKPTKGYKTRKNKRTNQFIVKRRK